MRVLRHGLEVLTHTHTHANTHCAIVGFFFFRCGRDEIIHVSSLSES